MILEHDGLQRGTALRDVDEVRRQVPVEKTSPLFGEPLVQDTKVNEAIRIPRIVVAKLGLVLHVGRRSATALTWRSRAIIGRGSFVQVAHAAQNSLETTYLRLSV